MSKLKLVFRETVGSFEIKFHMKAYGRIEMKIQTKKLGLMTNMAATPIYRKNLKLKKFLSQNL